MVSLYPETRAALRESELAPRKRLGQHFLIHENVLGAILRLLELSPEDRVVEIGPGLGFLTRRLAAVARSVWAIEVDPGLARRLSAGPLGALPSFHLIEGDVLGVSLATLLPERPLKLVANLPYNISTPVIFRLFDHRELFSFFVLMVQREVAERIAAAPGTKAYGSLSVWCQAHGRIVEKVPVSPEAFYPRPAVRSMILKIAPHREPLASREELGRLRALVRAAFGQRRKTLSNALAGGLAAGRDAIESVLAREGIDPRRRGETLSLEEFLRLAHAFETVSSEECH